MPDPSLQEMRVEEALQTDQAKTKPEDFQAHVSLDSLIMEGLTEDDKKMLKELDMDGSGKVELSEILGLLRHHKDHKSHTRRLLKTFLSVVAVLVVLLVANTVLTFGVIEFSKESKVQTGTLISATSGVVLNTANSEMSVNADGMLIATSNDTQQLPENKIKTAEKKIKTTPSLEKVVLASSLPDSTLMGLDEVTVHSDKGHTLQIKVHGFSRVPVLNSRCGNIVHFYTAWKGRITLDSTDISFDEATANEFANAGFSLAVGGVGGRRLAGKIKTDGFFKNMQDVKKSGEWKCAGVPLPTTPETRIVKQTMYFPCGAKADSTKPKHGRYLCDSRYGGFVHGAGLLDKKHALAVAGSPTQKGLIMKLELSTPEVIYAKTRSTTMRSRSYSVEFASWPSHPGQELITIYDRTSKATVAFQLDTTPGYGNRSHCTTQSIDVAEKSEDDALADKKVDTDMHFEFIDTVEEDGKVLRHFRMMTSSDFALYMAGKDFTPVVTEFWDIADTLQPYRIMDVDLIELDSISPSCSDSEVEAALAERVTTPIKDLMKCSDAEKGRMFRPTMTSSLIDLTHDDVDYYTQSVFTSQENMESTAELGGDTSENANFARYLVRTKNQFAMPDSCYALCKPVVDTLNAVIEEGVDMCGEDGNGGTLGNAMNCLDSTGLAICVGSEFASNHRGVCISKLLDGVENSRRLSDWEEDLPRSQPVRETLLPVRTLPDGTQEADLSQSPPHFQAALAQQLGMDSVSSARILFNITEKHNTIYDTGIDSLAESRKLSAGKGFGTGDCTSKRGSPILMSTGNWCMEWEFVRSGFKLNIEWGLVSGYVGLAMDCKSCTTMGLIFGLPPPLSVEFCVGGKLSVNKLRPCPDVPLSIGGSAFWNFDLAVDFFVWKGSLPKLTMNIGFENVNFKKEVYCWWFRDAGSEDNSEAQEDTTAHRRRWWSRRRRNRRACTYNEGCDVQIMGTIAIEVLVFKAALQLSYYVKNRVMIPRVILSIKRFWIIGSPWKEMYQNEFARYDFKAILL